MKSKMIFLLIGVVTGLFLFYFYNVMFPQATPIGDNGYLVKGKYFVFEDPQSGIRILEKTKNGILSKVFIPGPNLNSSVLNDVGANVIDMESGDIVQTKRITYDENSMNVNTSIYRYDGDKLIRIPYVDK